MKENTSEQWYSLINVSRAYGEYVDGVWIQDFFGTLQKAHECARLTEKANSNRITVAVVHKRDSINPDYSLYTGLKRL